MIFKVLFLCSTIKNDILIFESSCIPLGNFYLNPLAMSSVGMAPYKSMLLM
jgi:hypothetical protein